MLALTVGQLVRVLGEPRTLTERIVDHAEARVEALARYRSVQREK